MKIFLSGLYLILLVVTLASGIHQPSGMSPSFNSKDDKLVEPGSDFTLAEKNRSIVTYEDIQEEHNLAVPFNWHYLQKLNGQIPKKLLICCVKDVWGQKNACLRSPHPVCPITVKQCSYMKIRTLTSQSEYTNGCCCVKNSTYHAQEDKFFQQINVKEVRTDYMNSKACVCLLIMDNKIPSVSRKAEFGLGEKSDEKISEEAPVSKSAQLAKSEQINITLRKKRGTISNPMIYPNYRHINDRKRTDMGSSNFEVKMEAGVGPEGWSMGSRFNYDDFRRRYKREIQVMMTRYRKKRSPRTWSQKSEYTPRPKYFSRQKEILATTPDTFLNVSFTGYTENRKTTTTTTTKKPKAPLRMTEKDMEFVYGQKKKEPK